MHKSLSKTLTILLTLAVFFSTVAAAPAENKSLVLLEVRHVQGAGIILLFDSTGMTNKDIQGGTANVHSIAYDMSCGFKDESDVVRCLIPASLSRYAGETFRAYLAGFLFWPKIPAPRSAPLVCTEEQIIWYTVGIFEDGVPIETEEMPAEIYEWWVEIIAQNPEDFAGITLKILDRYCGPQILL